MAMMEKRIDPGAMIDLQQIGFTVLDETDYFIDLEYYADNLIDSLISIRSLDPLVERGFLPIDVSYYNNESEGVRIVAIKQQGRG